MSNTSFRLYLAALGMISFFAWWWLVSNSLGFFDRPLTPPPHWKALLLFAIPITISSVFALTGPLGHKASWCRALILGAAATIIYAYLRFRYDIVSPIPSDYALNWLVLAIAISWPFLITHAQKQTIWDYHSLHEAAWTIFVRGGIAFVFGWVFVSILWLADHLFLTVGLHFLDKFFDYDPNIALTYGAGFGLAAAVTWEMQKFLSVLRFVLTTLLRILLPLVAIILVIFTPMLFLKPLDIAISYQSPTALIMTLLIIALTVLSAVIEGEKTQGMLASAMDILCKLIIVLSAVLTPFMIYGIGIRIQEFGWTPERIIALASAFMIALYCLHNLYALIRHYGAWQEAVERGNIINAICLIGVSILLCSPLVNPYQISMNSFLSRLDAGKIELATIEPYSFRGFGKTGQKLFDALEEKAKASGDALLIERFHNERPGAISQPAKEMDRTALLKVLPLYPDNSEAQAMRAKIIAKLEAYEYSLISDACLARTEAKNSTCAMIFDQKLGTTTKGAVAKIMWSDSYNINFQNTRIYDATGQQVYSENLELGPKVFDILPTKGYRFEPVTTEVLKID